MTDSERRVEFVSDPPHKDNNIQTVTTALENFFMNPVSEMLNRVVVVVLVVAVVVVVVIKIIRKIIIVGRYVEMLLPSSCDPLREIIGLGLLVIVITFRLDKTWSLREC